MKINREEALNIIYDVADGEVSEEKRVAFFQYLKNDEALRLQYQLVVLLKDALRNHLKKETLSDDARGRMIALIHRLAAEMENEPVLSTQKTQTLKLSDGMGELSDGMNELSDETLEQLPDKTSDEISGETPDWFTARFWIKPLRTIAAAAVLLAITLFTIEILDHSTMRAGSDGQTIAEGDQTGGLGVAEGDTEGDLEQIIYKLFSEPGSFRQDPFWSFAPDVQIEQVRAALQTELRSSARLPEMEERDLRRIYGHPFFTDHLSPVLAYHHPKSGEWIYIFAFDIIELEQSGTLHRDPAAVRYCQKDDLYHVKQIGGKDIVSWQWEGHWYTAISNHKGDELIALLD